MGPSLFEPPQLRPTDLQLWPYQAEAIDAIRGELYHKKLNSTILILATGLGKTVIAGMIMRRIAERGGRSLFLAHRGELIDQAVETLTRLGLSPAVEKAGSYARAAWEPDVVVATVQTMQGKRLKQWPKDHFKFIITDECFPAGTTVDGRSIEDLKVGDTVLSFNHSVGILERKPIVRTFRSNPSYLVRVTFDCGESFVCTPGHPIFTYSRPSPPIPDYLCEWPHYKLAIDLRPGDSVYHLTSKKTGVITYGDSVEDVCGVRDHLSTPQLEQYVDPNLLGAMQGSPEAREGQGCRHLVHALRDPGRVPREERPRVGGAGTGLLFPGVQTGSSDRTFFGDNGADQSAICVRSHEGQESDGSRGDPRQGFDDAPAYGAQASDPGGQRSWADGPSAEAFASPGLDDGGDRSDWPLGAGRERLSDPLQTRRCSSGTEDRDRDRREFPRRHRTQGEGSQERATVEFARVACVEILEPGSDGRFGGLCPDGHVYNIEVEGNRNYFARDILVHNCHHSTSTTYHNVYRHFRAKHLGLTATPDRADEESLSEVFESIAYEYSLWDAMLAPPPGPYLSRLRFVQCDIGIDLRDIRTTGGDLNVSDLEEAIRPHIEALANAIRQEVGDRKTLVFTPDVGSAMAMASALDTIGVRARWVSGDAPDRKDTIDGFRRGEFQALTNCNICSEGFDVRDIGAIALCRPTKSRCLYSQQVGRGTRLYPGKENCILVDFNWLTAKHKLVRPTELFDTTRTDSETLAIAEELLQGKLPLDAPADAAGADLMDVIERADVEKKRRTVLRIQAREREMRYRKISYDPLAMMETIGVPVRAEADRFQGTITPGQRSALEKFGMTDDLDSLSKRRASQILDVLVARAHQNLARPRQVGALIRHGIEPDVARAMTFQEAHEALDKLFGRN